MRENPPVSIPPSRPAPVGAQGKPTLKDPQEIEDFLLYRLFRITHVGLRGTDDMYKRELGISRREWRILAYLARTPDASLKALAADAGIDVVVDLPGVGREFSDHPDINLGWQPTHKLNEPGQRDLFQSVFGQPMSQAHWQWKYANGHGEATGVRNASGKLVAHYGAMPRPILFFGQDAMAVQIGDVMVLPEARGVWSRSGPFSCTWVTRSTRPSWMA